MGPTLFGLSIATGTQEQIADRLIRAGLEKSRVRVFPANAHYLNMAVADGNYRRVLGRAEVLTADGAAVVWSARLQGIPVLERASITDLVHPVLEKAQIAGLKAYFLGGTPGTAERASAHFCGLYGGDIDYSDGYFHNDLEVIDTINRSGAEILFVGLGAPKQEFWVDKFAESLKPSIIITAGGLFDYYSGNVTRAPQWMQDMGMEWLYRLSLEPMRLWRRYLLGNPLYVWNHFRFRNMPAAVQPEEVRLRDTSETSSDVPDRVLTL